MKKSEEKHKRKKKNIKTKKQNQKTEKFIEGKNDHQTFWNENQTTEGINVYYGGYLNRLSIKINTIQEPLIDKE